MGGDDEHEAAGATKEQFGNARDDDEMQREGRTDQTKSSLKRASETVKDAFHDH